jgi:hypothetical protein
MAGWEWDELTGHLSAIPTLVLSPRTRWSDIACRLVAETIVADGTSWMLRFEALSRLLAHPRGAAAAVAACADLAADPSNQVFVEPVSVLDASGHPDAARRVIAQLTSPTNDRTRYGALLACIRKLRFGHFTEEQVAGLVPAAVEMLLDPESYADASALAVELLRRLPRPLGGSAEAELHRALANDRTLAEVHQQGRLASRATSAVVVHRITNASVFNGQMPGFTDDVLPVLVDEMLFAPILDVRLYAAMMVGATPYRGRLAAALASELTTRPVVGDTTLAASLLGALRVLGGPAERTLVERLVLARGLSPDVTGAAVQAIGHVGGASSDRFWLNAIALYGRSWRRHHDHQSANMLTGLVYAMGIARNHRLLAGVRDDDEAPWPVRSAASWWLTRRTEVMASATR